MLTDTKTTLTTQEVAARFDELARQEKFFDIQDEFFTDDVKSIDPSNSPYFGYAEGKANVRKKAMDFVKKVKEVHEVSTTPSVVGGNFFSVGRIMDLTTEDFGRVRIEEIMLYEVKNGRIISEQFFY